MTSFLGAFAFLSIFIGSIPASAAQSINVQTFTPSTSDQFVIIEDANRSTWPKKIQGFFGVNYNFLNEPLVETDPNLNDRVSTIISSVQTIDAFIGYNVSNRIALVAGAPLMHGVMYPDGTFNTSIGDMRGLAKIRITPDDWRTNIALIPELRLPTGSADNLVSDSSMTFVGRVALERQFKAFTLGINLGYLNASNALYRNVDYRTRVLLGLGLLIPLNDQFGLNVEYFEQFTYPQRQNLNPNELYFGGRYVALKNLVLTGGFSLGSITGPTGQDIRIVLGLRYFWMKDEVSAPAPVAAPKPVVQAAQPAPAAPVPLAVFTPKKIETLRAIAFAHNDDELTPDALPVLDEVAALLIKHQKEFKRVLIEGHSNNIGSEKLNLKLSLKRAQSVRNYLIRRKIPASRILVRGFGSRVPKVPYTNPDAQNINRRVEFTLVRR
jgi:outer membrane protein OmpA-like peptidoglycan-associated protein